MPSYWSIRRMRDDAMQERVIDRLLTLRKKLAKEVTKHKTSDSFLLATWNIRDFDKNRFGYGKRLDESIYYIAEIISSFDLVAIQEVNRDTTGLDRLMKIMGPHWTYIMTDTTEGRSGNQERMAYLYDKRRISFRNLAGEIVLPDKKKIGDALQFARSPFMVGFQAGWFKMNLCTVHIYYGAASGEKKKKRIEEIKRLSKYFEELQDKEAANYILLGDFNIVSPDDDTMKALKSGGFRVPKALEGKKSNLKGDKHYDQIAIKESKRIAEIGAAGVFKYDDVCFQDSKDDFAAWQQYLPKNHSKDKSEKDLKGVYRKWRTWQLSDHLPLWVQIKTDFTDDYLKSLRPGKNPLAEK